jgi:hypothetical protein
MCTSISLDRAIFQLATIASHEFGSTLRVEHLARFVLFPPMLCVLSDAIEIPKGVRLPADNIEWVLARKMGLW